MRLRWAARSPGRLMRLKMSADDQLSATADKFGEAYFMDPASGSAYRANNYLETALLSRTYFEMAEIIARCFGPKRILEVGCAAGPTVYHLNTYFETEAHGVDVSEWAVQNRLHPNISQATAGKLSFPDAYFDLVFSCHMLEHLTLETVGQSIREMSSRLHRRWYPISLAANSRFRSVWRHFWLNCHSKTGQNPQSSSFQGVVD